MRISGGADEQWFDAEAEVVDSETVPFAPLASGVTAPDADTLVGPTVAYEVLVLPEVLPTVDEPPSVGAPASVAALTDDPAAQASAIASDLRDPDFVPENPAWALSTAGALEELAAAYTPETAAQLEPTMNHWLQVGQQQLDGGTWNEVAAPADSRLSEDADTSSMGAAERSRREQYAALGMSPAEIDAEYERMRAIFAQSGLDIDDVRVATSAPGKSPLDWAEENLPRMNVEGIVGTRMDSGIESLQASFADRGGDSGYGQVGGYGQSYAGNGGQSVEDLIDEMSPPPMYTPVETAVNDLYAEYTMRDLPLYCFEYSERLRDQLVQSAPDTNPVVIEFPSGEEHGMNHYAVQIDTADGPMIIDLTADQFALLNGNDRVGPEVKSREQMEQDMLERGFQSGRPADMSPLVDEEAESGD